MTFKKGSLVIVTLVSVGLLAAHALSEETKPVHETIPGDCLFNSIYTASIKSLGRPDLSFDELEESRGSFQLASPAPTSKTCSQRCSKSCSVGCTTTRGCSTKCKAYTEGCQGGGANKTDTAQPTVGTVGGLIPRSLETKFSVKDLQTLLKVAGYEIEVDGNLGPTTYAAVGDFQRRNGLPVTGVADSELWKKLCQALSLLAGPSGQGG